jgi:hypothetical protein
MAVKIHSAVAGDGGEPATEAGDIAERVEAGKGLEENILDEVFDGSVGDFREENAVDHAGVTGIEETERGAIAILRGLDERDIGSGRLGGGIHGREPWRMERQLKVG